MFNTDINWWTLIVAAASNMVLGNIWYNKKIFGSTWMQLAGLTEENMKNNNMAKQMTGMITTTLVMTYVMATIVRLAGASDFWNGAWVGVWMWLGFIGTVGMGMCLWENKPFKLYALNTGYYLVALMLMGGILASW